MRRESIKVYFFRDRNNNYLKVAGNKEAYLYRKDLVIDAEDVKFFEKVYGINKLIRQQQEESFSREVIHINKDYSVVTTRDEDYHFPHVQANVVRLLVEAFEAGDPWVYSKSLLLEAGSETDRIHNLFKRQIAWKRLFKTNGKGKCRLDVYFAPECVLPNQAEQVSSKAETKQAKSLMLSANYVFEDSNLFKEPILWP